MVPEALPVTEPEAEPTEATDIFAEPQLPPPASDRVVECPAQTALAPVMAEGRGFTVTGAVVRHPVGSV